MKKSQEYQKSQKQDKCTTTLLNTMQIAQHSENKKYTRLNNTNH